MIELAIGLPEIDVADASDPYYRRAELVRTALAKEPMISTAPQVVGTLGDQDWFSAAVDFEALAHPSNSRFYDFLPRREGGARPALDLKLPFEIDTTGNVACYTLPDELGQFEEAIRMAAIHEHTRYPRAIYDSRDGERPFAAEVGLTIDQDIVPPGRAQRAGLLDIAHRDSSGASWLHLYMVCDTSPTRFFELAEPIIGGDVHGMGDAPEELGEAIATEPFEVVFANSTSLHRSPVIDEGARRTFLRLTYKHSTESI